MSEFIRTAKVLAHALGGLVGSHRRRSARDDVARLQRDQAVEELNDLASASTTQLRERRDGQMERHTVAPSQLSMLARMALEDLAEQRMFYRCVKCERLFRSSFPDARYCSTSCRYVYQKRVQRRGGKASRQGQ